MLKPVVVISQVFAEALIIIPLAKKDHGIVGGHFKRRSNSFE